MASKITRHIISGTTIVGGTATEYTSNVVRGNIKAIHVEKGTLAVTSDMIISDNEGQTILTLTDITADGWYYPRANAQDAVGADRVYIAAGQKIPVDFTVFSLLKTVLAQTGDAKTFKVTFLVEEY